MVVVPPSSQVARDWKGLGSLVPRFLLCGMKSHAHLTGDRLPLTRPGTVLGTQPGFGKDCDNLKKKSAPSES